MTLEELQSKIKFVRRRHNIRQIIVCAISFAVFYFSLSVAQNSRFSQEDRFICVILVIVIFGAVALFGSIKNLKADKKDCNVNSLVCPKCGKQLYDFWKSDWWKENLPEKTGKCFHCNENLIE